MHLLAVHGCVQLISDAIGTLPVDVPGAAGAPPRWVESPSPDMDRVDLVTSTVTSLLLDGNAFLAILRDASNRVAEVSLLDPTVTGVERRDGRLVATINGRPYMGEIRVVRGLVMPGKIRGLSPVEMARQVVGLGLGAQDQAARFFSQGSITPGVIQVPGSLSVEQMREVRRQWLESHGGSRRAHLPVVLTGDARWQGITMTAEQAQFLESRRYTDAQIAGQLFRVDPSLLGIPVEGTSLTYSNLEQRGAHLVRHTLLPWIVRLERAFSQLLPAGQSWRFNVDGLLRSDLAGRYASYQVAAQIQQITGEALLTVDEMRELEDLPPMQPAPETARSARSEARQVDLDLPGYIRAAAARGLELREQGFGGDGLTDKTIREAREMAAGRVTEDKVIRANAWAARHAVDLDAAQNSDADADGWPGPGAVAHYLWGISPLNPEPARRWFASKADAIKAEL